MFDQFKPPKPVGSGLVIQPVGQRVLAKVDALERGNRVTHMFGLHAQNGKRVLDVIYDLVGPNVDGLAIHRAALFDALWQAMQTRNGITHVTAADVTSVRQNTDSIEVFTTTHDVHGPFDLCIDSAGAASPRSRPSHLAMAQSGARSIGPKRTFQSTTSASATSKPHR
ncbi:MAG: hypothetical protein ABF288_08615 [Octadecabacter sp.]